MRRAESGDPFDGSDLGEDAKARATVYARELIEDVVERQPRIDSLIAEYAERWTLDRMPVLDRSLARLAVCELLREEVPVAVVVNEAVELAKELSTEDSPRFLNGLLGRVAEVIRAS